MYGGDARETAAATLEHTTTQKKAAQSNLAVDCAAHTAREILKCVGDRPPFPISF